MAEPEPTPHVDSGEEIARHCRQSGHMRPGEGKDGWTLFMPPAHKRLSVYRVSGLSTPEIEAIGEQFVASASNPVKGHVTLPAALFIQRGLTIEPVPDPHPRHADVRAGARTMQPIA